MAALPSESEQIRKIERLVTPEDLPDEAPAITMVAPWEMMLTPVRGREDEYSPHWCCPRCLSVGGLGHAVTIEGHGLKASKGDDRNVEGEYSRDYIHISPEHLGLLSTAGDLQVTVNPSIGCTTCGFHCFLEGSYRVVSDYDADGGMDPEQVIITQMGRMQEHRPEAFQRLLEAGYSDPDAW